MASDELGLDKPGALARYFAERWLEKPSARGEQLIAWLLEAALGRNALYFIERTKEYADAWGESGEVVPVDAFNGFVITGDPVEDTIIPHAVLVWTCMNDQPWSEKVYHDWLDKLLEAGSLEAAYLAASLWPAHDLMAKVTYRPAAWLVHRGQLDDAAERVILTEMLQGCDGQRTSLYGSFEYDDFPFASELSVCYIRRHGFTHPICGLVDPENFEWRSDLTKHIQEALAAPSWSEGVKGAAMLLYLSLKTFNKLNYPSQEILDILEKNLFKLDERHINIINFHIGKIKKIDYNLIKDYINYLIILCHEKIGISISSIKILNKYISIGLKTNDIIYIGRSFKDSIFNLMLKEKEKVELWLKKQTDDLRIKDILLAASISKKIDYLNYSVIQVDEELKTDHIEKKIEDIYGKIKYNDKIFLLINQVRKYFFNYGSHKICNFIYEILKREAKINFICNFIEDYDRVINSWHPNRNFFSCGDVFNESNHIGLYLYFNILKGWPEKMFNFRDYMKEEKQINLLSHTKNKIIKNLRGQGSENLEIKINSYLNKIINNNFPCEEAKHKLINELIEIIINYYDEIQEYMKNERNILIAKDVVLSNIKFFRNILRDPKLKESLGIYNKSQNIIFY